MGAIPVVDISALLSDRGDDRRESSAKHLSDSIRYRGCAAIVGHGMSEEDLQKVFGIMRKLFSLPPEEKAKAKHPDSLLPHRGYSTTSLKRSDTKDDSDVKNLEAFDFGHEENKVQENIWLPENVYPGFRETMADLFQRLNTVSLAILDGLISGMHLSKPDVEELRQIHSPVYHQMRLAHYLPLTAQDRSNPAMMRLAPHKDFASYTLLFQESAAGLEFHDIETGNYLPATPQKGALYLNIGEILERYSNGFYPAATHRVVVPSIKDADAGVQSRYSIPYFAHVSLDQSIFPLKSRVEADGKAKYEPIETQTMMYQRFRPVQA